MSMLRRTSLSFGLVVGGRLLHFSDLIVDDGENRKSDKVEEMKEHSH